VHGIIKFQGSVGNQRRSREVQGISGAKVKGEIRFSFTFDERIKRGFRKVQVQEEKMEARKEEADRLFKLEEGLSG